MAAAFNRLSPRSRRQRFLAATSHLTNAEVRRFTDVDHRDHEALAAFDDAGELVGIAEFVRPRPGASRAEVAIVVIDDWQGCGAGSALIELLTERARALGVESFYAYCFADNVKVIDLLDRVGSAEHHPSSANLVEMQMNLDNGSDVSLLDGLTITARRPERSAAGAVNGARALETCSQAPGL